MVRERPVKPFLLSFLLVLSISCTLGQENDSPERGKYFSKKSYVDHPLPTFEANKAEIPSPIIDGKPEYVELYWKAWSLAFEHFKKPPKGSPFVSNFIDEAFAPQIFQWDTIFMILFARYAHHVFPAIESLDNFYVRQHDSGYICREIFEADGGDFYYEGVQNSVNPPLFSWAEVETYKLSGDKTRFAMVLPVLEKYAEWLETGRKKPGTQHGLYWQTSLGSGMDNSPRVGSGWVDMSAQMVLMYNNLALMYDELNKPDVAEKSRERAKHIGEAINRWMWNEEDGLYYDVDDTGKQIKCKTVACFWPMLVGISSSKQVERMLMNLKDSKTFWRHNVFPSLAADHPEYKPDGQYWLGSVWAPTNVMVVKGLDQYPQVYNSAEFASLATEKYLDGIFAVYKRTGTIWENYSPEFDMRGIWSKPDFVGWTGCGPIQLLIENVLGFRPEGAKNRLTWNLQRIDRHGIERLHFGKVVASLLCEKRKNVLDPATVTIESNQPFELVIIRWDGVQKAYKILQGKQTIVVN